MDALQSAADRPTWNREAACSIVRAGHGILRVARSKENTVVYPLRLDEFKLAPQMRSDKCKHQSAIHAVVLEHSFRQHWPVSGATANHSVQSDLAGYGSITRVGPADV